MSDDELTIAIRYQTALFTAIAGVLVARDLSTREDIAVAMDVLAAKEGEPTVRTLLGMVSAVLRGAGEETPDRAQEFRPFEVLLGGRA